MKTYPVHVARSGYRGNDPKKRAKAAAHNRDAALLESCANELLKKQTDAVQVYHWAELANASGLPHERVAELGYSIDGGSNGFTAWRHDLTYDAAMDASRTGSNPSDAGSSN